MFGLSHLQSYTYETNQGLVYLKLFYMYIVLLLYIDTLSCAIYRYTVLSYYANGGILLLGERTKAMG